MKKNNRDYNIYSLIEAFASCAIEGNKTAKEMIDLWNSGQCSEFIKRLEKEFIDAFMPNNK